MLGTDRGKKTLSALLLSHTNALGVKPNATGQSGVVVARRVDAKEKTAGFVLDNITTEPSW